MVPEVAEFVIGLEWSLRAAIVLYTCGATGAQFLQSLGGFFLHSSLQMSKFYDSLGTYNERRLACGQFSWEATSD